MQFFEFTLADDQFWVAKYDRMTVDGFQAMLENPARELNRARRQVAPTATEIQFNPNLSVEFLVTYDLNAMPHLDEEKQQGGDEPWIVTGVHTTNRISIRAPHSLVTRANLADDATHGLPIPDPTLYVRLIDDLMLSYFHFDPSPDEQVILKSCASLVANPRSLKSFLETRAFPVHVAVTNSADQSEPNAALIPAKVRYTISDTVQIHLSNLPTAAERRTPCSPTDNNGNCVKAQGDYTLGREGDETVADFTVTEVFRLPYCIPADDGGVLLEKAARAAAANR